MWQPLFFIAILAYLLIIFSPISDGKKVKDTHTIITTISKADSAAAAAAAAGAASGGNETAAAAAAAAAAASSASVTTIIKTHHHTIKKCAVHEKYIKCPAKLCQPQVCDHVGFPLCSSHAYKYQNGTESKISHDEGDKECHGPAACVCVDNYVRDDEGVCIPVDECPSCGGDKNATFGCGVNCGRRCSNYKEQNVACPEICYVNSCDCKDEYVFDDNTGKCVLPEDCSHQDVKDPEGSEGTPGDSEGQSKETESPCDGCSGNCPETEDQEDNQSSKQLECPHEETTTDTNAENCDKTDGQCGNGDENDGDNQTNTTTKEPETQSTTKTTPQNSIHKKKHKKHTKASPTQSQDSSSKTTEPGTENTTESDKGDPETMTTEKVTRQDLTHKKKHKKHKKHTNATPTPSQDPNSVTTDLDSECTTETDTVSPETMTTKKATPQDPTHKKKAKHSNATPIPSQDPSSLTTESGNEFTTKTNTEDPEPTKVTPKSSHTKKTKKHTRPTKPTPTTSQNPGSSETTPEGTVETLCPDPNSVPGCDYICKKSCPSDEPQKCQCPESNCQCKDGYFFNSATYKCGTIDECSNTNTTGGETDPSTMTPKIETATPTPESSSSSTSTPTESTTSSTTESSDLESCASVASNTTILANLAFNAKILAEVTKQNPEKNLVISGSSILYVLPETIIFTSNSENSTKEILNAVASTIEQIKCLSPKLFAKIYAAGQIVGYDFIYSLYADVKYKFTEKFVNQIKETFTFEPQNINFSDPAAVNIINDKVVNQTDIEHFVKHDILSSQSSLIIVDAKSFRVEWEKKFDPEDTTEQFFFRSNYKVVKIPMMYQSGTFLYAENTVLGFKLLQLKFKGGFSCAILLPNYGIDINTLVTRLSAADQVKKTLDSVKPTPMDIYVPKFNTSTASKLKQAVIKADVKAVFNQSTARLKDVTIGDSPYVSEILQKISITIDETGSDSEPDFSNTDKEPTNSLIYRRKFKANRPFVYYIFYETILILAGVFTH